MIDMTFDKFEDYMVYVFMAVYIIGLGLALIGTPGLLTMLRI